MIWRRLWTRWIRGFIIRRRLLIQSIRSMMDDLNMHLYMHKRVLNTYTRFRLIHFYIFYQRSSTWLIQSTSWGSRISTKKCDRFYWIGLLMCRVNLRWGLRHFISPSIYWTDTSPRFRLWGLVCNWWELEQCLSLQRLRRYLHPKSRICLTSLNMLIRNKKYTFNLKRLDHSSRITNIDQPRILIKCTYHIFIHKPILNTHTHPNQTSISSSICSWTIHRTSTIRTIIQSNSGWCILPG